MTTADTAPSPLMLAAFDKLVEILQQEHGHRLLDREEDRGAMVIPERNVAGKFWHECYYVVQLRRHRVAVTSERAETWRDWSITADRLDERICDWLDAIEAELNSLWPGEDDRAV